MITVHRERWKRLKAEDIEGQLSVTGKKHKMREHIRWVVTQKGQSEEHILCKTTTINL